MASVLNKNNKSIVVYWYIDISGKRKQKWESCDSIKEAKRRKAFVEFYQQANGLKLVPKDENDLFESNDVISDEQLDNPNTEITVKEFFEEFVNIYGVSKWSLNTFNSKKSLIQNYINPYLGDMKLKDISTRKLSQFYIDLLDVPEVLRNGQKSTGRCVQPANIKKIHEVIRSALNQAILWEYLDINMRNPANFASLPKSTKEKRVVWSIETYKAAMDIIDDQLLKLSMHLAFSCSLRIGEICGLTWNNVIIDDQSIETDNARIIIDKVLQRVPNDALKALKNKDVIKVFPCLNESDTTRLVLKKPKTESSERVIWLPKTIALLLQEQKNIQERNKDILKDSYIDFDLVLAFDNGAPVERDIIGGKLKKFCLANDFEVVVFHSLRHLSTGYKLKLTNGDIKSVQGDTGHAEAEMVMDVYSKIIDEDRRKNAKKLEESFYSAPEESVAKVDTQSTQNILIEMIKSLPDETKEKLIQECNIEQKFSQ